MSVNLSAGQLRDASTVGDLKRLLERNGCEPGWLQLEITETSMVRDVEGASLVLAKLRTLGVRVAIDDFGTGFSSLSHLRHLPVDVLKIDKAFVADIDAPRKRGDNAGGAAIASAVIGLARGLGLKVVAEGVEKRSQLNFLTRAGCDACQGYLLCPPLAAPDLEKWIGVAAQGSRQGYQRIETRAPPSGESLIHASPPCHSATLFTMASPNPTPPLSRPRLPSSRVNGSKRRSRSARRDAGTVVVDRDHAAAALLRHREHDTVLRVAHGVAQHVHQGAREVLGIAGERGRHLARRLDRHLALCPRISPFTRRTASSTIAEVATTRGA